EATFERVRAQRDLTLEPSVSMESGRCGRQEKPEDTSKQAMTIEPVADGMKVTTDIGFANGQVECPCSAESAMSTSVLILHNHPSGDPVPSPEDMELTRRLAAAI